jgi:predicted Ser/Thr protein kinase
MDSFKSIVVKPTSKQVKVENPTSLPLIGRGLQGAVFLLPDNRCVKIYAREQEAERERMSLQLSSGSPIIPTIYETGKNYMIMEYFNGPTLFKYLSSLRLISTSITYEILYLLREIERLGFKKQDVLLQHIFITKYNRLKLIDHVNSYTVKLERPYLLFNDLKQLGLLSHFLDKVKRLDPYKHQKWREVLPEFFS